jgi:hypothetical protein
MGGAHAKTGDHDEPGIAGKAYGILGARSGLEPQYFRATCDRLARDIFRLGRWPEHLDHVEGHVHLDQGAVDAFSEDLTPSRIDRDDPVALRLKVARDLVRRLVFVRRGAHHRDGPRPIVDPEEILLRWPFLEAVFRRSHVSVGSSPLGALERGPRSSLGADSNLSYGSGASQHAPLEPRSEVGCSLRQRADWKSTHALGIRGLRSMFSEGKGGFR